MLREGHWVRTKGGKVGYIDLLGRERHLICFPDSGRVEYIDAWKLSSIEEPERVTDEFIIELALMTNDKEWFMEVT